MASSIHFNTAFLVLPNGQISATKKALSRFDWRWLDGAIGAGIAAALLKKRMPRMALATAIGAVGMAAWGATHKMRMSAYIHRWLNTHTLKMPQPQAVNEPQALADQRTQFRNAAATRAQLTTEQCAVLEHICAGDDAYLLAYPSPYEDAGWRIPYEQLSSHTSEGRKKQYRTSGIWRSEGLSGVIRHWYSEIRSEFLMQSYRQRL